MAIQANIEQLPQTLASEYHSVAAIGPMLDRVFTMRYLSYSTDGYIDKNVSQKFMDKYDSMPNNSSFLTYKGSNLIGSIRASIYVPESGLQVPAMEIFEHEIKENVDMNKPFMECNKLVIHPDFQRKGGIKARANLIKNVFIKAAEENCETMIIAIRSEHFRFYRGWGFSAISESKAYPGLKFDTTLLRCNNVKKIKETLEEKTLIRACQ